MNERNSDELIHAYLQEARSELPERAYAAVRRDIDKTPQRIVIGPWRTPFMNIPARYALPAIAVVAVIAIVAAAGLNVFGFKSSPPPAAQSPVASASPFSTPSPAATPTGTPWPNLTVLNGGGRHLPITAGRYAVQFPSRATFALNLSEGWTLDDIGSGNVQVFHSSATSDNVATWITLTEITGIYPDPCHTTGGPTAVEQTVDAVTRGLTGMVGLQASTPEPVQLDGISAMTFTLDNDIDTSAQDCSYDPMLAEWRYPVAWNFTTPGGTHQRIWVIDQDGGPLVAQVMSFPWTTSGERQEAEDIVGAISFK